jgi:hypothetical protein
MAYRVIFWKPQPGVDVWQPATRPLGESIRDTVRRGGTSDLLRPFSSSEFLDRIREVFPGTRVLNDGRLNWTDDLENGFQVIAGLQYVEACLFDLNDGDFERFFAVAQELDADHYDWGN